MRRLTHIAAGAALILGVQGAWAADLYHPGSFSALAGDRVAQRVGDSLTVIVAQSSLAQNTTQNGAKKSSTLHARAAAGQQPVGQTASLDLDRAFDGAGQTGRVDKIAAQISVVVDGVLPNGDLHVAGAQSLKINGERTNIRLMGRVRRMDITPDNTVLSTRLADAAIDYDGAGFVTNGSKAGIITHIFDFLGLP